MPRVVLQRLVHLLAQHQVSLVALWLAVAVALVSATDLQNHLDLDVCSPVLIRRQLQVAYRCQPDEFLETSTCGQAKKTIACPKGRYLAVHSASRGRSQSTTECSTTEVTNDTDCRVHCVIRQVETMCLGKHRCTVSANSDRLGEECPVDAQTKPLILRIRYACVRRVVLDQLKHDNGTSQTNDHMDDDCPEEGTNTAPINYRRRGPVTPIPIFSSSSSYSVSDPPSIAEESRKTSRWNAIKPSEGFVSVSSAASNSPTGVDTPAFHATDSSDGVLEDSVSMVEPREHTSDPPSALLLSISEWLWTWRFVSDNVEKSVLYLLCSLCFGVILLLLAVTINLACCSRMRKRRRKYGSPKYDKNDPAVRLADSNSSVKWRSPESESSTGDDKTFQGDEDGIDGGHNHRNPHHPRHGYPWHRGASGPSAPPTAVSKTESPGDLDGTDTSTALMKSRRVSDGEILPPIEQQGTRSLPRRTAPHLWYNEDASDESPVAESARTLQPLRHYNI